MNEMVITSGGENRKSSDVFSDVECIGGSPTRPSHLYRPYLGTIGIYQLGYIMSSLFF